MLRSAECGHPGFLDARRAVPVLALAMDTGFLISTNPPRDSCAEAALAENRAGAADGRRLFAGEGPVRDFSANQEGGAVCFGINHLRWPIPAAHPCAARKRR